MVKHPWHCIAFLLDPRIAQKASRSTPAPLMARDRCAACRINGTDIKDKTELIEARKKVEREMERFKVRGSIAPMLGMQSHLTACAEPFSVTCMSAEYVLERLVQAASALACAIFLDVQSAMHTVDPLPPYGCLKGVGRCGLEVCMWSRQTSSHGPHQVPAM